MAQFALVTPCSSKVQIKLSLNLSLPEKLKKHNYYLEMALSPPFLDQDAYKNIHIICTAIGYVLYTNTT